MTNFTISLLAGGTATVDANAHRLEGPCYNFYANDKSSATGESLVASFPQWQVRSVVKANPRGKCHTVFSWLWRALKLSLFLVGVWQALKFVAWFLVLAWVAMHGFIH